VKVRYERLRYMIQLSCAYKYMHSNNYTHYFSEGENNSVFFPHLPFSKQVSEFNKASTIKLPIYLQLLSFIFLKK